MDAMQFVMIMDSDHSPMLIASTLEELQLQQQASLPQAMNPVSKPSTDYGVQQLVMRHDKGL